MTSELKRCPLNGAASAYRDGLSPQEINNFIDKAVGRPCVMPWQVDEATAAEIEFCGECGAIGTTTEDDLCDGCSIALAAWNTRKDEADDQ